MHTMYDTDNFAGDKIDMHYRGTLEDTGAEFDASVRFPCNDISLCSHHSFRVIELIHTHNSTTAAHPFRSRLEAVRLSRVGMRV